ncbi:MAG TPA: hypothetical protein DCZ94_04545 [Lentisphaeria bacterium]|nr:MAG: hypothetical protein A2X48_20225 [Lentisphaerae bacterium GWF2_49_21]HBC86204.1 hypothetical protein [Lentisphaeria bacterium]
MRRIICICMIICAARIPAYAADKEIENVLQERGTLISKANDEAIKKLDKLMITRTKKGDLDGALAVKGTIQKIKGGEAPGEKGVANADVDIGGLPGNPLGKSEASVKKEIEARYQGFTKALVTDDVNSAYEYMDPKIREGASPQVIKGYLNVMGGMLKLAQVPKDGAKITSVKIGVRENDAKVVPALKIRGLNWEEQKPGYWVLRNGKWYLGDEKELENFK